MKLVHRIKQYKKAVSISLIAILLAIGVFFASTNPFATEGVKQATTAKQEPFTELYFENHTKLPTIVEVDKPYSFSFTIHNLENKDKEYHYEIYADLGDTKEYIDKSSIFVRENQSITLPQDFTVSSEFTRLRIVVNLIEKKQQIAFWIEGAKEEEVK